MEWLYAEGALDGVLQVRGAVLAGLAVAVLVALVVTV